MINYLKFFFIGTIIPYCNTCLLAQQINFFEHNGLLREYILYTPSELPSNAPLIFALHGYNGTADQMMNLTEMNKVADTAGFVVCYPQGSIDQGGSTFWNVGYDFHVDETVNDVDFLKELAKELQRKHNLNPGGTFLTGFSNGADMAYRIACEAGSIFKATAPVAGALLETVHDRCTSTSVKPMFIINGTDDPVILWEGDLDSELIWGDYYGVPFGFDFFSQKNECTRSLLDTLPDKDAFDGSIVATEKCIEGKNGSEVWLYSIIGGRHHWPGDEGNMDIHLSTEIWKFFSLFVSNNSLSTDDDEKINEIYIYPNPAVSFIKINANTISDFNYQLLNRNGKTLSTGIINSLNRSIDVSHLPPGMYLLRIETEMLKFLKLD